ncbi:MAG: nicotinate (nicotinamide) nucleotide adenylyltransferase [Candidatus Kapaibacteriota bacterium]
MKKLKKIGLFGGSFNPIHIGHLIVANFFVCEFDLDYCFFQPTFISPFKLHQENTVSEQHRLKMISLAIRGNPKFKIDTYEIDKAGISYSFETILHFRAKFPNSTIFFLVGSDQIDKFTQWKNWKVILENSYLVVAKRDFKPENKNFVPSEYADNIYFLNNPIIGISSTQIREFISNNIPIDYLVPKEVKKYIFDNKLYK